MPHHTHADDAAVREQAYYLWEQDGRPHGRETEYWTRAQIMVTEKGTLDPLTKAPPKKSEKPKAVAPKNAAASKTKAAPAKAEPARKPKKK